MAKLVRNHREQLLTTYRKQKRHAKDESGACAEEAEVPSRLHRRRVEGSVEIDLHASWDLELLLQSVDCFAQPGRCLRKLAPAEAECRTKQPDEKQDAGDAGPEERRIQRYANENGSGDGKDESQGECEVTGDGDKRQPQ